MTVTVAESWVFSDGSAPVPVAPDEAVAVLRRRIDAGAYESWLTRSSGRLLAVVSNGHRAMVVLLDGEGDPGAHATDPGAEGWSDGFILANGQGDEYPDVDTVPLDEALRIVRHILATGRPPADTAWTVDR